MSRTTLVVGASGHLGGAVAATLREAGHRVVGTYCSTPAAAADVDFDFWTDDPAALVAAHDPDAVVFAAAPEYGGVAQDGGPAGSASFVDRAERFAAACGDRRLVYVSSAAVFDGETGGYVESDDRSPRDGYGRRLVAFEDAVAEHCVDAAVVRTSYQYGPSRGVLDRRLARTREAVAAGESVAYFADMTKGPVAVGDVAAAIRALAVGDATGVVHVSGPRTSVYAFHRDAMAALGADPDLVTPEPTPEGMDVAPDRSLRSERFDATVGVPVRSIEDALRNVDAAALSHPE